MNQMKFEWYVKAKNNQGRNYLQMALETPLPNVEAMEKILGWVLEKCGPGVLMGMFHVNTKARLNLVQTIARSQDPMVFVGTYDWLMENNGAYRG